MKELNSYPYVVLYLERIFDLLNVRFFASALSRPTITIQTTPHAYGHFTTREDTWVSSKDGGTHEINMGAGTLSRPIEKVVTTMLHEMVHYWNYNQGIKDCSRGGKYHNRHFKDAAEAHHLIVKRDSRYGWCITEPSDKLRRFVLEYGLTDILINRNEITTIYSGADDQPPKKSSTRKYICPCCGMSVRATREVNIACVDCDERMRVEMHTP